ncbi:hypothetical protein H4R20_002728 [Coemansia guatemalensis]|uniref:ATP11-domain-containing protein n=1 Tax=Coemansia guatemalensis TaxID=2761395 RepID=A0A9W8I0X8_9FUNG|nr:hypothetical protein H4R20_002728 [Coemansia guatemalensis]
MTLFGIGRAIVRSPRGLLRAACTAGNSSGIRLASHASPLTLSRLLPLIPLGSRKQMSHVPDYEEKYREKLLRRAREEGVETVGELRQKIKKEEEARSQQQSHKSIEGQSTASTATAQASSTKASLSKNTDAGKRRLDRSSHQSANNLPSSAKSLDQIMRMDLLSDKSAEETGELWTRYHATKDMISAVIPSSTYRELLSVAQKNPLFVLPLPRSEGIEFFFLQFDYHQVYFTSLLEYKTNTMHARPFLTLTHYTDFIDSKGVVLMRGEIDSEARLIDTQNAQYLALQMQQFYVTGGKAKRCLLEQFNQNPDQFDYNKLIEAAEKL